MEPLDDLEIEVLQGSSLDPCPQAATEILWLRSEIERLRAENRAASEWQRVYRQCDESRDQLYDRLADALSEVEWLRAALNEIRGCADWYAATKIACAALEQNAAGDKNAELCS